MQQHCECESSPTANLLWRVLESFTPRERCLFIKFGSGRMSLPAPGMSWGGKLIIRFEGSNRRDKDKPLPTAAVCSTRITIPNYGSEEVMAEKLRTAILMGADIDLDRAAQYTDLRQFT
jgi:E3 ubiquitin-protein ligase HERC1